MKPRPEKALTAAAAKIATKKFMSHAETAVYFVKGFFDAMKDRRVVGMLNSEEFQEFKTPEDAFISELIFLAIKTEVWIKKKKLDYEDLCDGVYLYEIAEDLLPNKLWTYFIDQYKEDSGYCFPDDVWVEITMLGILEALGEKAVRRHRQLAPRHTCTK
jgi:hypothetical protein